MKILQNISIMCAIVCSGTSVLQAGILSRGCADSCTGQCCEASSDPSDYCCVGDFKSEKIKLHCFESKCEPVVIPPVKFPCGGCCFSKLCGRGRCGSCSENGCSNCGDSCGGSACGNGGNGFMSRLFGKFGKCRVRCVSKYKKKEYECGTKCVCSWKAVPAGGCGNGNGCGSAGCGNECATGCTEGY